MSIIKSFRKKKSEVPQPFFPTEVIQPQPKDNHRFSATSKKKVSYILLILALAAVPTIYFYTQNKNTEKKLNNLQQKSQSSDNVNTVVEQVSRLVLLPTGEQPTLATISDASKLRGQPFFAGAVNGDKVLVYNKAGKAILYRPSLNKIVEMAPLDSTNQSSQ